MLHAKLQGCIFKFRIFNKALKLHNGNRWLIPNRSVDCSLIHDNFYSFFLKIINK